MNRSWLTMSLIAVPTLVLLALTASQAADDAKQGPDEAALTRTRKTVRMLDDIYKTTIVLITDKYVLDETDFAAGSAAVELFSQIGEKGWPQAVLLDVSGEPYDDENVADDAFEKAGIKALKSGKDYYEQVVTEDGKHLLRAMTAVPVVHQRCVMCHAHYADAKKGEPIGAISYTVPIE